MRERVRWLIRGKEMIKGQIITCPYCGTKFPHSGLPELQECPKCHAKLLTSNPGSPMITDVDTCLKEIADWYVEKRRKITVPELEAISLRHCEDEAEVQKFLKFLETEPGEMRFRTLLRERKEPLGAFICGQCGERFHSRKELEEHLREYHPEAYASVRPPEPREVRKFPMGQIVMTRGVNDLVAENAKFSKFVTESLARHARGDWGDLSEEDKKENEYSLTRYLRLFSAYEKPPLPKIWIITEADRSVTTVLFPEEY